MRVDSLQIKDFRNYEHIELQFHPKLNIVTGNNAQGKTNLLESIYYLSVTRSFRTNRDQEMIKYGKQFFFIKGIFEKDGNKNEVKISYQKNGQLKLTVNKGEKKRTEYILSFPVVVFSPDDLMIIREGPSIRRRFINLEASRLNNFYLANLKDYHRAVLQRNHILKENKNRSVLNRNLEPWDHLLVKLGGRVIRDRIEILKALEREAQNFYHQITSSQELLSIEYMCSIECDNLDNLENKFISRLETQRDHEIARGTTLFGPHLDDIKISIDEQDTRKFSSQGQKRTVALALKMGEARLFYNKHHFYPVLLLDDVFSELDSQRQRYLLDFLYANDNQSFITTVVDLNGLDGIFKNNYQTTFIKQGHCHNETGWTAY